MSKEPPASMAWSKMVAKRVKRNDYTDGWFIGVTPRLVVGTWVGGEDRWIRFLSLSQRPGTPYGKTDFCRFYRPAGKGPQIRIWLQCAVCAASRRPGHRDQLSPMRAISAPQATKDFFTDIYNDELDGTDNAKPGKGRSRRLVWRWE